MLGTIIGLIIIGLVAGSIARALVPGKQSMTVGQTIILGIVGSFIGGFLGPPAVSPRRRVRADIKLGRLNHRRRHRPADLPPV